MTSYIILALCVIIILAYIFDITGKYSKIPGVILLIALGIGIQLLGQYTNLKIPNLKPVLPVLGTIGLILIILEASLDLKLQKRKKTLILKSISSAFFLFTLFSAVFAFIMTYFFDYPLRDSLLNGIPLGIISSSVVIQSSIFLTTDEKEFVLYESSFSSIFGILLFDLILIGNDSVFGGILNFAGSSIITLLISIVTTAILAILLHKIEYHIHYVVIITSVLMIYMLAEISHLPALLLIVTFGLVLSNNRLLENTIFGRYIDYQKFSVDLTNFRKIITEFTFLARSFFFIIFGYYTRITGLLSISNILTALAITASLFILRLFFIRFVLKMPAFPLLLYIPRGLITIILFLSIPLALRLPLINEEVITLVILMTIFTLVTGNIILKKKFSEATEVAEDLRYYVSEETLRLRKKEAERLSKMEREN